MIKHALRPLRTRMWAPSEHDVTAVAGREPAERSDDVFHGCISAAPAWPAACGRTCAKRDGVPTIQRLGSTMKPPQAAHSDSCGLFRAPTAPGRRATCTSMPCSCSSRCAHCPGQALSAYSFSMLAYLAQARIHRTHPAARCHTGREWIASADRVARWGSPPLGCAPFDGEFRQEADQGLVCSAFRRLGHLQTTNN